MKNIVQKLYEFLIKSHEYLIKSYMISLSYDEKYSNEYDSYMSIRPRL